MSEKNGLKLFKFMKRLPLLDICVVKCQPIIELQRTALFFLIFNLFNFLFFILLLDTLFTAKAFEMNPTDSSTMDHCPWPHFSFYVFMSHEEMTSVLGFQILETQNPYVVYRS